MAIKKLYSQNKKKMVRRSNNNNYAYWLTTIKELGNKLMLKNNSNKNVHNKKPKLLYILMHILL